MSTRVRVSSGLSAWAMTVLTVGGKFAMARLRALRSFPTHATRVTPAVSYLWNIVHIFSSLTKELFNQSTVFCKYQNSLEKKHAPSITGTSKYLLRDSIWHLPYLCQIPSGFMRTGCTSQARSSWKSSCRMRSYLVLRAGGRRPIRVADKSGGLGQCVALSWRQHFSTERANSALRRLGKCAN